MDRFCELMSCSESFVTMSKKPKVQKRLIDKSKLKLINLLTWRGSVTKNLANLRIMIFEGIVILKNINMKFIIYSHLKLKLLCHKGLLRWQYW